MTEQNTVAAPSPSEQFHLGVDDLTDCAVFVIDLAGRIATWNGGSQQLKGYTAEEIIGQPFSVLFTPEDRRRGLPEQELAIALASGLYKGEGQRLRKDGTTFLADVTLRCLRDPTGAPRGFLKVTRDITERRQLEAVQRQRLELEEELLGMASHDLRNPINAILLTAQTMLSNGGMTTRQTEGIARIASSAQRASRMLRDLLDFTQAKLGGGLSIAPVPLRLQAFVAETTEEVLLTHPGRKVELQLDGDTEVEWDPDRCARLIANLLANALEHGAHDLPVTVRARWADPESVAIEIHNFGEAIPPGLLPDLFQRFSQGYARGRRNTGGIGLGLFIVDQVARAHGGEVSVQSDPLEGTTFTVRIPRRTLRSGGAGGPGSPS